ncbi:hypothetical protein JAAARDRAFT_98186, partial [Jaapia argillacea MUCL 33604]
CGADYQTREHIPTECPRYETHRHYLREVSSQISLPVILGTRKGINALSSFIMESGAFTKTGEPGSEHRTLPCFDEEPDVELSDEESDD